MFSYQHHIGDFNKATRHLTRVERSIYRDMLDLYYETEKPLPDDIKAICRLVIARENEESTAVEQVLNEFFHKNCDGWAHVRCELEIEKYRNNSNQKSEAGKASAAARAAKRQQIINGRSTNAGTAVERDANVDSTNRKPQPITNNLNQDITQDKPAKKSKAVKPDLDYSIWPQLPDQQILNDWIAMRKAKRAPLSQTVLDTFGGEFKKAATFGYSVNDCLRTAIASGWTGFKFSWMQNQNSRGSQNGNTVQPKSPIERFMQQHYPNAGTGFENDQRPMGGDDGAIRGAMDSQLRGDAGQIRPVETDIIGSFTRTDS
jgi:uncharacterized protein YdaU (DUF1376 family)